jgi:hypothetical protein
MNTVNPAKLLIVKIALACIAFYSLLALVFHIRWFVPFLVTGIAGNVPAGQLPLVWFPVQILSNIIFLIVAYHLLFLFLRYQKLGFFDRSALRVFNVAIFACISFACLASIQVVSSNLSEAHLNDWNSIDGSLNLLFRTFTNLLVLREPQSLFLLLSIILWVVKQFVCNALELKAESDSII